MVIAEDLILSPAVAGACRQGSKAVELFSIRASLVSSDCLNHVCEEPSEPSIVATTKAEVPSTPPREAESVAPLLSNRDNDLLQSLQFN